MSRGGARKGAGRKRTGSKTVLMTFSLSPATLELLRLVPRGARSAFIEGLIRKALT